MDWQLELVMAFRALLAAFLGGIVGFERERHGQDAGIRTYGAVALGACVFGLVSMHALGGTNIDTRIAAQVVSGVGFLGAGVIIVDRCLKARVSSGKGFSHIQSISIEAVVLARSI